MTPAERYIYAANHSDEYTSEELDLIARWADTWLRAQHRKRIKPKSRRRWPAHSNYHPPHERYGD